MSTADHILDQIDNALHDWSVSDDAMRSRPEPAVLPEPRTLPGRVPVVDMHSRPEAGTICLDGFRATVMAMDEAGEWQDLGGARSVDFHIEPPQIDPDFQRAWREMQEYIARVQAERVRRAQEALEAFARAYTQAIRPAMEAAAKGLAEIQKAAQHVNPPLPPGRRHDRPAWQSPYGPARRRR